ncbi:MAG: DUF3727 domain-containing protein [Gloeomargarita sp. SKYG116]|nr:DUF3727 domain-containing protein [Gloeomargarita sp. SKYG116]MCS7225887.1 DUF3727 domain-containing protein [Gloeomargarita sp. SKYB31]MDW8401480.1 DUF3727 domain-containing protein [Gloeomargarita sp. SKYGB_i_bin116]
MGRNSQHHFDIPAQVVLVDDQGRSLACYVDRTLEVDERPYLLLLPVDTPVELFAWNEAEDTLLDLDEEELAKIFPIARDILAEQNLKLLDTALTLTAQGELPQPQETETLFLDYESQDGEIESEEFQELGIFYHEGRRYGVYTPIEPLLFFARINSDGQPEPLSAEEMERIGPRLEAQLLDELDD